MIDTMEHRPIIQARNINVSFYLQNYGVDSLKSFLLKNLFRAPLRRKQVIFDISLEVQKGECLGILGRNGSGKTTLLRVLSRIIKPDSGVLSINGRIAPVLALGIGLEPEMSGIENIKFLSMLMGWSSDNLSMIIENVQNFSELSEEDLNMQVKRYSSGMIARLGFSVATAEIPDILIIDEALAVGDIAFREKCYQRILEIQNSGCTIIFVSQNPEELKRICNRVIILRNGHLVAQGTPDEMSEEYHKIMKA